MGKNARTHRRNTSRFTGSRGTDSVATGKGALTRGRRFADGHSLRITWYSNAPWCGTGYGQQTAQAVTRIIKEGHELAIHAMFGLEGSKSNWNGITVYPRGVAAYSDDIVVAHTQDWANGNPTIPPLLITLFDVWPLLKSKSFHMLPNIASWVPIDHKPAPPEVLEWCSRKNVMPIAMSRFGEEMLKAAGVDCLYVPHGIE